MAWRGAWEKVACPLACPSLLAEDGAVADAHARLGWREGLFPLPPGTERLLRCRWGYAALSGETDGLSLMDERGQLLLTAPAGVYPQDMCPLPDGLTLAVCGGADSRVRLFSLPGLRAGRSFPVPGHVQRIAWGSGALGVLSLVEEEGLRCLVSRISLGTGRVTLLATLPGLPGAICADGRGGWWAAATEQLCHVDRAGRIDRQQGGWGLIRHIERAGEMLLLTDPVLGACAIMDATGRQRPRMIHRGDVRQAIFL